MVEGNLKGFTLDFSMAELRALQDLFCHFHPDKSDEQNEKRVLQMAKGCFFHWAQQVERISKAVAVEAHDGELIKELLIRLPYEQDKETVEHKMQIFRRGWPKGKPWVDWWMRPCVQKMAFLAYSDCPNWRSLPSTNNLVEAQHTNIRRQSAQGSYDSTIENMWRSDFTQLQRLLKANLYGLRSRWSRNTEYARQRARMQHRALIADEASSETTGRNPGDTRAALEKAAQEERATSQEREAIRFYEQTRSATEQLWFCLMDRAAQDAVWASLYAADSRYGEAVPSGLRSRRRGQVQVDTVNAPSSDMTCSNNDAPYSNDDINIHSPSNDSTPNSDSVPDNISTPNPSNDSTPDSDSVPDNISIPSPSSDSPLINNDISTLNDNSNSAPRSRRRTYEDAFGDDPGLEIQVVSGLESERVKEICKFLFIFVLYIFLTVIIKKNNRSINKIT